MTRIICFGDSITIATDDLGGGWPQRLNNYLRSIYIDQFGSAKHPVYNLGISGDTSASLLERIEPELQARTERKQPLCIIYIGTNDAAIKNGSPLTAGEDFAKNLDSIYKITKKYTNNVIALGLLPCDDTKLNPVPWVTKDEFVYSRKNLRAYDMLIKKQAASNDIEYIHLFDIFGDIKLDTFLIDGLHPNGVGHQLITDRMKKRIAERANNFAS